MTRHEGNPVRLADYRSTAYAIDTVALDVAFAPHATRVKSRLALRRRDDTPAGTPLRSPFAGAKAPVADSGQAKGVQA